MSTVTLYIDNRLRIWGSLLECSRGKWWLLPFIQWNDYWSNRKLYNAAKDGHVSEVKSLLARGVDPNHPKCYPLHIASCNGHLKIVKALVEAGADTERRDAGGRSPVHWAAFWGHKEVLVYLIRDCKSYSSKLISTSHCYVTRLHVTVHVYMHNRNQYACVYVIPGMRI